MDVAKVVMLKLAAVVLFGMPLLIVPLVTAQNLPSKDELEAIEEVQLTNQQSFPTTRGRKLNSFR